LAFFEISGAKDRELWSKGKGGDVKSASTKIITNIVSNGKPIQGANRYKKVTTHNNIISSKPIQGVNQYTNNGNGDNITIAKNNLDRGTSRTYSIQRLEKSRKEKGSTCDGEPWQISAEQNQVVIVAI